MFIAKLNLAAAVLGSCLLASGAFAAPVSLSAAQMDSVAAAGVETIDGFVCPVIITDAVLNSVKGGAIDGGFYTIGGPDVSVPVLATNAGTGESVPTDSNTFVAPGDSTYTAIWAVKP